MQNQKEHIEMILILLQNISQHLFSSLNYLHVSLYKNNRKV